MLKKVLTPITAIVRTITTSQSKTKKLFDVSNEMILSIR